MFKSLKKLTQKKDNICARTGCNNQIKRERNGTEVNYCSSSCQSRHYSPGSSELYDELDSPAYTSTSSNQWGVWSPNQDDAPPSYSSISNNNDDDIFGSLDNVQVTPLWENDDDLPPRNSNSRSRSRYATSSKPEPEDDFPIWLGSTVDPLWTPSSNKNNSSRNYSPPFTPPRSSSPNSDEGEINCPRCTYFIRPNKTVCEMCGASITRPEPKKYYKRPSKPKPKPKPKPKTTITSYRDLYEEEEEEEEEEEVEVVEEEEEEEVDIDDILNPFADPPPRRKNQSSYSSSDNYRNPSSSKSRNQSSRSSYLDDEYPSYSQSRNQSSSRSRTSYQTQTPPSNKLWIEDDEFSAESVPSRRSTRPKPPPKPYTPPSFIRDAPRRNVQKPPTPPPLKEKQITCSACNFDNHSSMTHCEICFTQLNKTPEPDRRTTRFNRIEETMAKRACKACSFYNNVDRVQCEMCYSPMDNVRNFISHDPDKKQCPTCTFMNHKSMAQCEMCRNALPGSNVQQQVQEYQQFVDNLPGLTTKMFQLPVDDHDYMTAQQVFRAGIPNAKILAIFRMIMPARLINAHEAYKKQIAGNNPVANVTHRMFHGTHVSCDATRYYGPPGWKHCTAIDCGLCGISQNGNSCAKSKYGGRMWFANNSQTSLGYCRTDPIKAMFIQEIISATGGPIIIVDREAATLVKFLIIFQ